MPKNRLASPPAPLAGRAPSAPRLAWLIGPALVAGEWALRGLLGAGGWEPLRVVASLAVVTVVVAAGTLAGERLGSILRPGRGGAP